MHDVGVAVGWVTMEGSVYRQQQLKMCGRNFTFTSNHHVIHSIEGERGSAEAM